MPHNISENQIRHIEMIEQVINRMAQNSFALKGWALTLVVAICALASAESEYKFAIVAVIPIVCFWFLDSFYLQKERKYRILFKKAIDDDLHFKMDIYEIKDNKTHYIKCLFSLSEFPFYLSILTGIAILYLLIL